MSATGSDNGAVVNNGAPVAAMKAGASAAAKVDAPAAEAKVNASAAAAATVDSEAIKCSVELALLTAGQPLDMRAMQRLLPAAARRDIEGALAALESDWAARALALVSSAGGYQFVSRADYMPVLRRLNAQKPPRLSRALTEILAIIAYRQPVTRGDIEQLRGIAVSASQMAFLEEQGWVEAVGRRETPGRPTLYATTKVLLDDLGLQSLDDLPALPEPTAEESEAKDDSDADSAGSPDESPPPPTS